MIFHRLISMNHHGTNVMFGCVAFCLMSKLNLLWLFCQLLKSLNYKSVVTTMANQTFSIVTALLRGYSLMLNEAMCCAHKWKFKEIYERFEVEITSCSYFQIHLEIPWDCERIWRELEKVGIYNQYNEVFWSFSLCSSVL